MMKKKKIITQTISLLILTLLALIPFIMLDWPLYIYGIVAFVVIVYITIIILRYRLTRTPRCKKCGHHYLVESKDKIRTEEMIVDHHFVFIHTYDYHYVCKHCGNKEDRIRSIKAK